MATAIQFARCDAMGRVSGRPLVVEIMPRRPGDATEVVAATERIRRELGWQPRYDDLEQIVRHALAFERRLAKRSGT
jgi:UDP-glucose 4-epimerase